MQAESGSVTQPPDKKGRSCENCGAELKGPYCYRCGQPTRSFISALPGLIREIATDTLYYDSRMWRTLKALLLSPGRLSDEYVNGRRARYTPPIRVYLVSSVLVFLMVGLVVDTAKLVEFNGNAEAAESSIEEFHAPLHFGAEAWHLEDNPVDIGWLGNRGNEWLNRQIDKIQTNIGEARRNPQRFVRSATGTIPQVMFVLLPLFSAMVGVFYLFSRRYYIEHLLLQVHNHSFLFLCLIGLYGGISLRRVLERSDFFAAGLLNGLLWLTVMALWLWMPVYLLLSMKRFYRQGWILTTVKFLTLAGSYFFLMLFAMLAIIILGIWRL